MLLLDKAAAEVIASQIWAIWSEHRDDERLSQKLLLGTELEMNAGNLHAAEKTFTNIIDTDPTFAEAWNKRATVYFLMGAFAQSKKRYCPNHYPRATPFRRPIWLGIVKPT